MAAQRDYYQLLGVAETATTDEIKKAFRRLAKQHHPDRNPNNPQAAERFKEINEAHDVLSDAAKGARINVCPECKGRGTVSFGQGGFALNRPCPVCRGKGTVPSQRCPTCQGSGEVRVEKRITVEIPPGAEDGMRLRLKNQGPKGRGDLIVQVQVAPDRFFRREGLDVIGVVPIDLAQALLGSRIKVKSLDGKRVVLRIPPGTQHGQKFRVPGYGIEKNGRRGDMYVEAHVTLPERLSAEEQEAVKSFAEKAGLKY